MTHRSTPDRLPPEREWSDLMGRADRVIADVARDSPRIRRRAGYLVPAIAAAAAALVAAFGIDLLSQPVAPSVTATAPANTPPPSTTTPNLLHVGDTADLRHAKITVGEVADTGRGVAVKVQTCVVNAPPEQFPAGLSMRIDDWMTVRNDHSGVVVAWVQDSDLKPAYPDAARVFQGECVSGWIPPMDPPGKGEISLIYRGELGEEVRWIIG